MVSSGQVLIRFINAAEYFRNLPEGCLLRSFGHIDDSVAIESWHEQLVNAITSHLASLWILFIRLMPLVDDCNFSNLSSCLGTPLTSKEQPV